MRAAYTQYLSPEERAVGLRAGAALTVKRADFPDIMGGAQSIAKTIATTALLTGIPLGVAAHLIGRHVTAERLKERELKKKIQYYRDSTSGLERGLANTTV